MSGEGDFEKKFHELTQNAIPKTVRKGMGRALLRLLRDSVMEQPTVPLDEGTLRGSGSIFVDGKFKGTSQEASGNPPVPKFVDGHEIGHPATQLGETPSNDTIEGVVGFNTPYATVLHEADEGEFDFQEPSAGPKYLENPMAINRHRYMRITADTIKQSGG